MRNKLATIANAAQYLATRTRTTDIWSADPRMARFFGLIEAQVNEAKGLLDNRDAFEQAFIAIHEPVCIAACIEEALALAGLEAKRNVGITHTVRADAAEMTVLISALLGYVAAAGNRGLIEVSAGADDRLVTLRVAAPLRAGAHSDGSLPLAIARRVGRRYDATIGEDKSPTMVAVCAQLQTI
jgi:hypothetical protein